MGMSEGVPVLGIDSVKGIIPIIACQIPTVIIACIAFLFLYPKVNSNRRAFKWALTGFWLAASKLILFPVASILEQSINRMIASIDNVRIVSLAAWTVYISRIVAWSLFEAFIYLCFLVAIYRLVQTSDRGESKR